MADTSSIISIRVPNSVRARLEARAAREHRKISALAALLLAEAMEPKTTPAYTLTPAEREFLAVLDRVLDASGIDMNDGRRIVRHSLFREFYKEIRNGANLHINNSRKSLEALKIVASDETHLWRTAIK